MGRMPPPPLAARSPAASRLFVFHALELAWIAADMLLVDWVLTRAESSYARVFAVVDLVWLAFAVAEVALLAGFRREVGAHPAAGPLAVAFGLAVASLGLSLVQALPLAGGPELLPVAGDSAVVIRVALNVGVALALDVALWFALARILGPALSPGLGAAFYALRFADAALSALPALPSDGLHAMLRSSPLASLYPWAHLGVSVAWQLTMLAALRRVPATAPASGAPAVSPASEARRDVLVGALWLGGGVLVTVVSYSLVPEGGGRYVVTLGPIVYGAVRLLRGLARAGGA
jgi:hypothetical protein